MAEFEVKLKLSLKRISMISIAQLFWKSPDIVYEINKFNKQKFKSTKKKLRYLHRSSPDSVNDLSSCKYQAWEVVIDSVLKKSSYILFLPCELKDDLQKIIVLMGQKIFYFYDEFWEASISKSHSHITREYFRCKKCIEGSGTEHFYSFSSFGTVVLQCPLLHSKPVPPKNTYSSNLSFLNLFRQYKHDNKFKEFLDDIVFYCDVETIEKYEKEIITFLNSLHPGLSFKNKDEVAFSIICLWKMMKPEEYFHRKYSQKFDENGYVRVAEKYLSKSKEFTIPLEVVPQLCINSNPTALQYFANKLHCLDDREHFSIMSEVLMAYELHTLVNNRLHYFPAPDYRPDKILKVLNFMSLNEKYNFIEKHLKDLFMFFLPVWPHQEIIPKILDFCEEKNLDLDYEFLFDLITACIGIENKNKYKIPKGFYLRVFERVWSKAPENIKMIFFGKLTLYLIIESPNNLNLKLILKDKQLKKKYVDFEDIEDELFTTIRESWEQLLLKKNFVLVKKFVSELVFLEKFLDDFLSCYDYPKVYEMTFVRKNYFKI